MAVVAPGVVRGRLEGLLVKVCVEQFGGDDLSLAGLSVEDGVVKRFAFVENRNLTERAFSNRDERFAESIAGALGLDLIDDLVVLDGQVFGDRSGSLAGEDQVEFLLGESGWAMDIMIGARAYGKTLIVVSDVLSGKDIGLINGRDVLQTEFFDHAILQS